MSKIGSDPDVRRRHARFMLARRWGERNVVWPSRLPEHVRSAERSPRLLTAGERARLLVALGVTERENPA